jgi:hypothetical protein
MWRQIKMKTWILTLDQEKATWLSNIMRSMRNAYHEDKPLILGSEDAVNAMNIIKQISQYSKG